MLFALLDPQNSILRIENDVDVTQVKTRPGYRWLPVEDTQPAITLAQPILAGPVVTVLVDKVTRVWTPRARTAQELDDHKAGLIGNVDAVQWKVIFNIFNDVRVLKGLPTVDRATFINTLKQLMPDT